MPLRNGARDINARNQQERDPDPFAEHASQARRGEKPPYSLPPDILPAGAEFKQSSFGIDEPLHVSRDDAPEDRAARIVGETHAVIGTTVGRRRLTRCPHGRRLAHRTLNRQI